MNLTPPLREDVHRRVGIPIDRDAAPRTIVGRNVIRGERVVRFDAERLHRGYILPEPYPDAVVYHAAEVL